MSNVRLYFKNEKFQNVGVVQQGAAGLNFSSLEWTSVFHKQDSFAMQCGVSDSRDVEFMLDKSTVYVVRNDTCQTAYINKKEFDGQKLTLEGIGVEGLLAKRFTLEKDYLPTGANAGVNKVGAVMCDIINDNSPYVWLRADRAKNMTGPSIATYTELTGNVYKYVKMLAEAYDVGFKCIYDEKTDMVDFITYAVVPYSVDIPGRVYRLSDELDNVKELTYEHDVSKYYNYVRVVGEDLTGVVDQSGGRERYEYSFKSRSRRKSLTTAEYTSILKGEGVQELAKRRAIEVFEVQPKDGQYVELGWEAVSIGKNINVATLSFCTEVNEIWESSYKREYTFGYRVDSKDDLVIRLQGELYS